MKPFVRLAIALLLAMTVTTAQLAAATLQGPQAKIRIAIWDFENNSERHWWFSNDLGPAARNHIDNAFFENRELAEQFSVIEREKLEMVLKEQGLATSGALDQQTAAKVGQVLGIKYIVTGAVDKFAINTTKGGFGGIGGNYTKAEATINMRFIDTTSAERVISVSADGDVKKGGGVFKGARLSREDEWGIASEAIEKAAHAVVEELVKEDYTARLSPGAGPMGGTEGKIIKVEGDLAWINMGAVSGIEVGDRFQILSVGEALVDPDTGQVLGIEETETGDGQVVEVKDRYAVIQFSGNAKAKDVVRKP